MKWLLSSIVLSLILFQVEASAECPEGTIKEKTLNGFKCGRYRQNNFVPHGPSLLRLSSSRSHPWKLSSINEALKKHNQSPLPAIVDVFENYSQGKLDGEVLVMTPEGKLRAKWKYSSGKQEEQIIFNHLGEIFLHDKFDDHGNKTFSLIRFLDGSIDHLEYEEGGARHVYNGKKQELTCMMNNRSFSVRTDKPFVECKDAARAFAEGKALCPSSKIGALKEVIDENQRVRLSIMQKIAEFKEEKNSLGWFSLGKKRELENNLSQLEKSKAVITQSLISKQQLMEDFSNHVFMARALLAELPSSAWPLTADAWEKLNKLNKEACPTDSYIKNVPELDSATVGLINPQGWRRIASEPEPEDVFRPDSFWEE